MKHQQRWKKLGLIYTPKQNYKWLNSHAAVPIAQHIQNDVFKIYFSSRDINNISYTSSVIMDLNKPNGLIQDAVTPVLQPGNLGEFDDSGAMGTWIAQHNNKSYFYYIGWNLGKTVPFRNSIGLAISHGEMAFQRFANGPIVDRTMKEPHFCASCCVVPGADKWRMWYLSCTEWRLQQGKPEHRYHIKYAESTNGIDWIRNGKVAIDYASDNEIAISRPSVMYEDGIWKMWFSYRAVGETYRIGYAYSHDGIDWQRETSAVLDISDHGWDSQMVEYPFVFNHNDKKLMLYNGNDFGKTGFGLAVLEN